jgi:peptidoglycan/LPS O-acetylase OafA/YrhL
VKNHFPLLDPLRFGAALSVAIFHQMFWSWAWPSIGVPGFERYVAADVLFPSAAPFTWFGWVGVEIFFVISGFVIANSASEASPTEFLLGRALRLYPAVWVCATATFLVLLLFGSGPASEFILPYIHAMLLVPKGVTGQWLDVVYWTLAAEMAFYGLVFCAMLTKKITLRHLAWGLTIYSAVFNAFALLVLSLATPSDIPYLVILMFRVPCAAFLLCHGCFFALGIWLFISANRKLTALERVAVAVTCLSGAAEIYFFASFFLTSIPAISGQSPLVPIMVWASAVFLIAVAANGSRRSAGTVSPEAPAYLRTHFLRTLGLITYPLYLTHNVIGAAIMRVLVDAGLDATSAVFAALSMLVLVCWLICAKIEPAVRRALTQTISYFGQLPKTKPLLSFPNSSPGPRLPLPIRAKANFTGR